jgi:hypothetical protein
MNGESFAVNEHPQVCRPTELRRRTRAGSSQCGSCPNRSRMAARENPEVSRAIRFVCSRGLNLSRSRWRTRVWQRTCTRSSSMHQLVKARARRNHNCRATEILSFKHGFSAFCDPYGKLNWLRRFSLNKSQIWRRWPAFATGFPSGINSK